MYEIDSIRKGSILSMKVRVPYVENHEVGMGGCVESGGKASHSYSYCTACLLIYLRYLPYRVDTDRHGEGKLSTYT